MMASPATPAETSGMRFMPASTPGETPTPATMLATVGSSRLEQVQGGRLDVEQLGGAGRDGVAGSAAAAPAGRSARWIWDSCSNSRSRLCSESTRRPFSSGVQAFGLDHVQGLQAEFQHPGHAAEQADVLGGEADADPAEDEQAAEWPPISAYGDGVRSGRQVEGAAAGRRRPR